MSSVDCPSENIIHIYSRDEIVQALSQEPSITLWNFRIERRSYEYWYCKACGRIHEVNVRQGQCVRRYRPDPQAVDIPCLIGVPAEWKDIYVITDIELDDVTEKDFECRLCDYLPLIPRCVMLSPDQKRAIVFDSASGIAETQYIEEAMQCKDPDTSHM